MRKDVAFIYSMVIITFFALIFTADYYIENWPSEVYVVPEYAYMFVIVPSFVIFVMSVIIGYYAHKALKVSGPEETPGIRALYDFMILWALIAFETFLGWLYFYLTKNSLCFVEILGIKVYVWYVAHAWFFPIIGGIAYSILNLGLWIGRKQSKLLNGIELFLLVLVSICLFLPWNYWSFSPPREGLFTRPLVYGISMIAGVIACIPGIKNLRERLKKKLSKIEAFRYKILMAGFISIIIFWVFLFLYCIALAMNYEILSYLLLGISGLGAGLSPIFLYLGLLTPAWLLKRIS